MATFWTIELSITGTVGAQSGTPALAYAPLQLTVGANPEKDKPLVQASAVQGSFTAQLKNVPDGGGTFSGNEVDDRDLALTRHLEWPDDAALTVDDGSAAQPVGTIRLAGNLDLPDASYQVSDGGVAVAGPLSFGVPLLIDIPYDPTSKRQQQKQVQTGKRTGLEIAGTASVTIARLDASLAYQPNGQIDMLDSLPVMRGRFPRSVSTTFACSDTESLIHGNSHIGVLVDGADAGGRFYTYRMKRSTVYHLNRDGTRGAVSTQGSWAVDTQADQPSWDDVPGVREEAPPAKWPWEETFDEYLVRVKGMPEFGALYFTVTIDTRPGHYRVRMSTARVIDWDGWCAVLKSPVPEEPPAPSETDAAWQSAHIPAK